MTNASPTRAAPPRPPGARVPFITRLRLRVGVAFGLAAFAACLFGKEPHWHGLPLLAAGLAIRLWAAGYLLKDKTLALSGPYRYVRHPLYLGTLLATASAPLLLHSVWLGLAFLLAVVPAYCWQIVSEEKGLERIFGEAYREYRRRVPALLPRPWRPRPAANEARFNWRLALTTNRWPWQVGYAILALLLMDITEDIAHTMLFHHGSLADGLRQLGDLIRFWSTGRF
jgi:protein-S-isoprenylcysteine O-methyltransferase Ste14